MPLVLATRNKGKIAELSRLLVDWQVQTCDAYPGCPVPEETGDTFHENALIKARVIASFTQMITLADDSGLEVDALEGAPGVYTARFAGPDAGDSENRNKLLQVLSAIPNQERTARFRCVMAIITPDGREWTIDGVCEGRIGWEDKGANGFGYDPIFVPIGYTQTFAELGVEIKNQISHRAEALNKAVTILRTIS
jgi:XTP/dITP diphosphohydrolase